MYCENLLFQNTPAYFSEFQKQSDFECFNFLLKGSHEKYSIPHGRWFELISCPNYLAEITIYNSVALIFWFQNTSRNDLLLWVLSNQVTVVINCELWKKYMYNCLCILRDLYLLWPLAAFSLWTALWVKNGNSKPSRTIRNQDPE